MKEQFQDWRTVLAWGSVIVFLCAPPIVFILEITGALGRPPGTYPYLKEFYFSVTGVLVSLAGLGTWESVRNGKHNKKE